ncbi:ThiF family adenylyltransferase, partial [uncultured Desulfovibrio sp.]
MSERISQLESAIHAAACDGRIPEQTLLKLAAAAGVDLLVAQRAACRVGVWPARYVRNARQLSIQEQLALLESHVLLVGLGGLGGWLLELLARLGVGSITGVDADRFEESNLNRQLLGNAGNLGQSKARAAAARLAVVNPAIQFTSVPRFMDEALCARLL